jgi:hypothetical protein
MPLTKSRSAITQLTGTGQSTTLSLASSYSHTLYISHTNGTGTITVQATAAVEVRTTGGSTWFGVALLGFGTTASATVRNVPVSLPADAAEVRIDYTAPTGSTGHTLDAEAGTITGI